MKDENLRVLVVCKHAQDSEEAKARKLVESEGFNVKYSWKNTLKKRDLKDIDLVISVGGDGTALSASHFLFDKPLLAVNSSPRTSEGALTTITLDKLHEKLEEIKQGKHKIERLERIEISINGKIKEPIALNEVFIANEKAYHMSKYELKIKHGRKIEREKQFSSGIIFSTGTGSTAWFKSAGGESFSSQERHIKLIVREPYMRNLHKFQILKRTIEEGDEIEVIPLTRMVLAIDSIREIKLKEGDKIMIKPSRYPLLRVR